MSGKYVTFVSEKGRSKSLLNRSIIKAVTTLLFFSLFLLFTACNSEGTGSSESSVNGDTDTGSQLLNHIPIFTSDTNVSVEENQISAITLHATDEDNDTLSYTLSGTDANSFDINSSTGVVTFKTAPDYESGKTSYSFTATVSDGTNEISLNVTISITDSIYDSDVYIQSAIYDNNRTASSDDDRLYIYYSHSIDPSSLSSDISTNYSISGTGKIGSNSASDYNDTLFHRHRIQLNSSGTSSIPLSTAGDTNISIAQNTTTDIEGNYPRNYNKTTVVPFNILGRLKTGQTTTVFEFDDGNTTRGVARSYTRDGANETVTDHATGLMWQDNADVNDSSKTQRWDGVITYCENLVLGGYSDWRAPSIEELFSIADKKRDNPLLDPAQGSTLDPTFVYVGIDYYWSSTLDANISSDKAWALFSPNGYDILNSKSTYFNVRCVRSLNN